MHKEEEGELLGTSTCSAHEGPTYHAASWKRCSQLIKHNNYEKEIPIDLGITQLTKLYSFDCTVMPHSYSFDRSAWTFGGTRYCVVRGTRY